MHRPKATISAIVTTRNRAALLLRALDSVFCQRGRGDEFHLEVIVVDDASTDATPDVMARHPGVRYLRLDTTHGAGRARNAGIAASTGTYLAFLDDDDEWLPDKLSLQVRAAERHPGVGLVYGRMVIAHEATRMLYPEAQAPSGSVFPRLLLENYCGIPAVPLARRVAIESSGGFDPALQTCEDYDMWLRLSRTTPFLFVPAPVAIYWKAQGKHAQAVRDGRFATTLRHVVNRAMSSPQGDALSEDLRRHVRATTELRIADAMIGRDLGGAWRHLEDALRISPRIAVESGTRHTISAILGRHAATTPRPWATLDHWEREIGFRIPMGFIDRLNVKHLLGDAYWEVAVSRGKGPTRPTPSGPAMRAALSSFWAYALALRPRSAARRVRSVVDFGIRTWRDRGSPPRAPLDDPRCQNQNLGEESSRAHKI